MTDRVRANVVYRFKVVTRRGRDEVDRVTGGRISMMRFKVHIHTMHEECCQWQTRARTRMDLNCEYFSRPISWIYR